LLVNPHDPLEIAEAMAELGRNGSLAQALAETGVRRASRFRWDHTAAEVLKVLEEVIQQG
jgi:glycosyltransferase involved in cell wall biosynthesis